MNPSAEPHSELISKTCASLLDAIRAARESVGGGLNDDEFTCFLRQTELPVEAGFGFLSFSEGVVTLSVPQQDLTKWQPEKGWIVLEKEGIARKIAEKHGLSLVEPPDEPSSFRLPLAAATNRHHHLELIDRRETVVVAHPRYLKVRLFGTTCDRRYICDGRMPVLLGPDLLQDLSGLYQP